MKKKKPRYELSLTLGDTTLKSEGATVLEALLALPKPVKMVSKAFFTIKEGTKKKEVMMMPMELKRLFYPMRQFYNARRIEMVLK